MFVYTPCISLLLMKAEEDFKSLGIGVLVHCEPNPSLQQDQPFSCLSTSTKYIYYKKTKIFFLVILVILLPLRSLLGLCDDCKQVLDCGTSIRFSAPSLLSA